ncbi:GPO family capsid scaffolding protein [Oceanobacter mangrovi]|uniref:GPO family capsid scaffolding protein n=1 Tax=Oceanobacter mangrovi TaxID=2862510 RepID=UPI001C8E86ED|nr:GPO family capsid scaffolding protein [Oceanobacter mangrovi]
MLLTDWLVIGTAGATIDGRDIPEDWLTAAAEQYDLDVYTAVINSDHLLEWYGSFGTVQQVRTGKSKDGKTTLEARINPNRRLVEMNGTGQKLFFSMEIIPEFADTGRAYLAGLAVTDQPASLGTSAMKFSANKAAMFSTATPLDLHLDRRDDQEPGWFKKYLPFFKGTNHTPEPQDDETMTPEQLNQITDAIKAQGEQFTNALAALKPAEGQQPPTEPATPPAGEQFSLGDVMKKLEGIESKTTELETQFATLKQTPVGGTNTPDHTGGNDDTRDVY